MSYEKKIPKEKKKSLNSKWNPIFPRKQNDYQGYTVSFVFLIIIGCLNAFRSIVHTFFPDGGAKIIAGFNFDEIVNVDMMIWSWAWSGVFQILYSLVLWMIIIRYRRFIPAIYVLLILENLLMKLVGIIKPLTETLPESIPPGSIGYALMLPLLIVFFILSMRKSPKKMAALAQ
ncbi:MAG: hypothetical protein ACTSWY_04920 [Promethearchaeota archaeon]